MIELEEQRLEKFYEERKTMDEYRDIGNNLIMNPSNLSVNYNIWSEIIAIGLGTDLKNPYGRMDIVRRWFWIPQALFDIFKFCQGLCLTFLSFI